MSAPEAAAAARPDESSNSQNEESVEQTVSPTAPITETEVGEYREQDRVLPVSRSLSPLVEAIEAILISAIVYFPRLDVSARRCHFNVPIGLTLGPLQCKHRENNEECGPQHIQDLERGKGCGAGVCVRVH